jgi:hypothetical protein
VEVGYAVVDADEGPGMEAVVRLCILEYSGGGASGDLVAGVYESREGCLLKGGLGLLVFVGDRTVVLGVLDPLLI